MLFLIIFFALCVSVFAKDVALDWVLTKEPIHVFNDARTKTMILINSTWPPPTTTVNVGDMISINVENKFDESTTLHAHGFLQTNNNVFDGPEGITQCGIKPGSSYTYVWKAEKAGTFWVHSHHPGQYPYGLRAPFIVKDSNEPDTYDYDADKDIVVDMSDTYYSQEQSAVDADYDNGSCGLGLEPPPSGVVINDVFNPLINTGSSKNGRMRLRFINMSAFSTMIIFLSGGIQMRIMEVDSVPINRDYMPLAKAIELNAGQRTSVIVDIADAQEQNFNIYATIDPWHYQKNPCAHTQTYAYTAVGRVQFNDSITDWSLPDFGTGSDWSPSLGKGVNYDSTKLWVNSSSKLDNLPSYADKYTSPDTVMSDNWYYSKLPPADAQPLIKYQNAAPGILETKFIQVDLTASDDNTHFANLNGVAFNIPDPPVLLQAMRPKPSCVSSNQVPQPTMTNALGPESFYATSQNPVQNAVSFQQGQTVIMMITSYIGSHTFHMHGHDFQVLYHQDEIQDSTHPLAIPDVNRIKANGFVMPPFPLRRDTLFITTKTVSVIAFTANNPGAWIFHCHNDFHAKSGMAGVFVTGDLTTPETAGAWGEGAYEQCGGADPSKGYPSLFSQWGRQCLA